MPNNKSPHVTKRPKKTPLISKRPMPRNKTPRLQIVQHYKTPKTKHPIQQNAQGPMQQNLQGYKKPEVRKCPMMLKYTQLQNGPNNKTSKFVC